MKLMTFGPGRAGPLPAYLGYLFLRFPGTLAAEETRTFEILDTYDRRWINQGLLCLSNGDERQLISPPSFYHTAVPDFGLQTPLLVARLTAKVRGVTFAEETGLGVEGQMVRVGSVSHLILRGPNEGLEQLSAALTADGLIPDAASWAVKDRAPFEPPRTFSKPSPTSPAAAYLIETLLDEFRVVRQYEAGVRRDIDTECLHQYRVHLRRIRSLVSLGRMWQTVPEWARLKNVLRILQQHTNELRDLDVLLLDLPSLLGPLPWDEGQRLAGWSEAVRKRRAAEYKRVRAWLSSQEHAGLAAETQKLLEDLRIYGEPWTIAEWQASAHQRAGRELARSLKNLGPEPTDEQLHEIRILSKKLRSVLGLGDPQEARELLRRLKSSQESLGRFQDHSVLIERLRKEREALRGIPAADLMAVGVLIGYRSAQHQTLKASALTEARQLEKRSFLRLLARLAEGNSNAARD